MSANNIQTALTEIPLSLEQADGPEVKVAKIKSNSLKRFFKTAKGGMTSSKSADATNTTSETKKMPFLLRYSGPSLLSGLDGSTDDKEAGSSTSKSGTTESRWSLSNYWTLPFKKTFRKSPTKEAETVVTVPQTDDKEVHQN